VALSTRGHRQIMKKTVVESYYDETVEHEWERLARHKMEYTLTLRAMDEYIPANSKILDVGGGPGRYSICLAKRGHHVTLLDLSEANIKFARQKAAAENAPVENFFHGNALDLSAFADQSFDVVLLMGPLYHLTSAADRDQAVAEAYRVLRPGGIILASFITRYATINDQLKNYPEALAKDFDGTLSLLKDGIKFPESGFTEAYFILPSDIAPLMAGKSGKGFHQQCLMAAEPFVAAIEPTINALDEPTFRCWADLCYRLSTDPATWGSAEHMIFIGNK